MKKTENHNAANETPIDILDEISDVKCKISFLTAAFTRILLDAGHCDATACGLQAIMFALEDDLSKISSAFDKKFNLPSEEKGGRQP
jgi:hypothetical protein